jgi:hypothetical protein
MELDVMYKVSKDLAWSYVNRYVHRSSVDLVIYRPCQDTFISKKTIRNAAGRLAPGGIFCLQSEPEIITWVIDAIEDQGMKYHVVYEYCVEGYHGQHIRPWILAYKGEAFRPDYKQDVIKITSAKKVGTTMLPFSDFGNTILCIGNESLPHAIHAKEMGRHVIVFADDKILGLKLHFEGVRGVEI